MKRAVVYLFQTRADLLDIEDWLVEQDGVDRPSLVMEEIMSAVNYLATMSRRGALVSGADLVSDREFRQIFKHGFRIIYLVRQTEVVVYAILHERRDHNSILRTR
jgi:plasmid stabilization system protein ParE